MPTISEPRRLTAVPSPGADPPASRAIDPDTRSDAELVARACEGDPETWSILYRRCYAGLYRQLRYMTGDRAIAEELAQETFAQAMTSRARYDGRKGFRPWLHGIALNVARKHWRRRRYATRASERLEALSQVQRPLRADPDDPLKNRSWGSSGSARSGRCTWLSASSRSLARVA